MWLVTCFNHAKADTWWDPSAKEMLDSSDVIALVEYSSEGSDYAAAKLLRIYKGALVVGNEIYISGFSNQYGPHDMMHIGDQYIVFLNLMKPWGSANEYFEKAANDDPGIMKFADALFQNNAYYVWTPTAGDYQVENGRVKFDLLNTGYHGNAALHSMKELDTFLAAYFEPAKRASFERKLIRKIKPASASNDKTQALMMLYLLDYQAYNPIFEDYVHVKNEYSRFALTQVLGNIHNKASDAVLLLLLDDRSSLVQGSSVRAMALCDPEIVGPALLSRLKDAGEYNLGPTTLMDPVRNSLSGGKYQIIETLGDIGYTPAIPTLLGMLETRNEDDFEHIVDALRKLGTDEYAQYINLHLDSLHHNMVYTLGQIIVRDSLSQCIPSLMYYISHHDRSFYPTEEKAVSYNAGLGFFKSDTVLNFLSGDFVELMKTPYTGDVAYDTKLDWVKEYLLTFMHLGIDPHKDLVYDFMYEYYGFNSRFRYEPVYFQKQQNIEDSITKLILEVLLPLEPNVVVSTRAFVDSNYNLLDYVSKFQIPKPNNFVLQKINRLDTLTDAVSEKTTINNRHLIAEAANSSKSYGGARMKSVNSDLMMIFLNYIAVFADEKDVSFIENLMKYYCANDTSTISMLNEYLEKARINASKKS